MKNRIFTILITIIIPLSATATHIVGGEMNYRCVGNNQYEISLTVFRDCFNGVPPFDVQAAVGVFDASNNLVQNILIPFIQDDTLQPVLFDSCAVIPPNVCVHRTTYIDTITLNFSAGGYKILYQRCCRNYTIANIANPNSTGATFYTFISEQGLNTCNSNPVFSEWPPIYICAGTPIVFDHSATDIDGDSLVYSLCAPFVGANTTTPMPQPPFNPPYTNNLFPYDTITWVPPYSTTDMMGGVPLAIDKNTGLLTGTPTILGQFVVGICVKEYRNGQLISLTKRDFQYNVGTCGSYFGADFIAPEVVCDGFDVSFVNISQSGPYFWDFGVLSVTNDTTGLKNPTFTYPDTGDYTVMLISGYGDPCADTLFKTLSIRANSLLWDVEEVYDACDDTVRVQFFDQTLVSNGNAIRWEWDFGTFTDTTQNPVITLSGSPDNRYLYRMIVTASNGCQGIGIGEIQTYPTELDFTIGAQECPGQEMQISVRSLDANDTVSYEWMPSNEIIAIENDTQITIAPFVPTYYFLETTNNTCVRLDTFFIDPTLYAPPLDIDVEPDTIFPGAISQLTATDDLDYIYSWGYDETLSDTAIFNPIANPLQTTAYYLTVTDEKGCIGVDTALVYVRPFECADPYIFIPNAFTPNDDGRNDILYVRANGVDDFYFAVYSRWGQKIFETNDLNQGWDGTFEGRKLTPDVFGYVLRVNCVTGNTYFKKGNITLIR
jgi:gliding motility-associated-like protein